MMDHPKRPRLSTIWTLLTRAFTRTRQLRRSTRVLLSAPGPVLDGWFESPILKAALGCYSAGGVVSIDEPLSGLIMSIMALQHQWGVRRPVGGVGEITRALAAEVLAHGGEVRTGARVARLTENAGGRVNGAETEAGDTFLRQDAVIGAIDPVTLFKKLMPAQLLPQRIDAELAAVGVYRNNFASYRADVALNRPLNLIVGPDRGRRTAAKRDAFRSGHRLRAAHRSGGVRRSISRMIFRTGSPPPRRSIAAWYRRAVLARRSTCSYPRCLSACGPAQAGMASRNACWTTRSRTSSATRPASAPARRPIGAQSGGHAALLQCAPGASVPR